MYGIKDTDLTVLLNAEFTTTGIDGFRLISRHTRSVWATIYDSLPHSSYQDFWFKNPWVPPLKYFRNVGLEYPPPHPPWKFGQDLALGIWVGMEYPPPAKMKTWPDWGTLDLSLSRVNPPPHPRTYVVGAGVWRLIVVFPKDTVSFIRYDSDCDRRLHNHYVTLRSVGVYVVQHWQWLHLRMGNSFVAIVVGQCEWS